jgi:uncharacterized Zn-binding protein involved in type VI secretion
LTGGKAANLSRLTASYQVPPGFCLTTAAFQASAISSPTNVSYDDVAVAYQGLAKQCNEPNASVAVRSSAVDEDGSAASFAGQLDLVPAELIDHTDPRPLSPTAGVTDDELKAIWLYLQNLEPKPLEE